MDIFAFFDIQVLVLIFSVFLGGIMGFLIKQTKDIPTKLALSLSGSYLFAISILHLIPEAYSTNHNHETGMAILIGFFLQLLLELFSKGIEHGHTHAHPENPFPFAITISLCAHAFTEGLPLGIESSDQTSPLLWAISIHKIPVAFILTLFLIEAGIKKQTTILVLLIFAAMAPIGSFCTANFAFLMAYHEYILGIAIGIFLHVSTTILFESSENHRFNLYKFAAILTGASLAYITH